jgi:hypothetical protein
VALNETPVWLSALPWICTGKLGRSARVGMSTACIQAMAGPEVPDW